MDYYQVLGIPSSADQKAIRTAFRALVRRYHPDISNSASSERFRQVVEAYETLSEPVRRRSYDLSHAHLRDIPASPAEPITSPGLTRRQYPTRPFAEPIYRYAVRPAAAIDELFEELARLFDEEFFFGPFFTRW